MKNIFKTTLSTLLGIICAATMTSCDKTEDVKSIDNCSIVVDGLIQDGVLHAQAGEPIHFTLVGEPDYVVFYSGEAGKMYSQRNMTSIEGTSEMTFEYKFPKIKTSPSPAPEKITYKDLLSVYVSTDYSGIWNKHGLMQKDPQFAAKEQLNIDEREAAQWTDVTDAFTLDLSETDIDTYKAAGKLDLTPYQGKKLFIGFKYKIYRKEHSRAISITNFNVVTRPVDPAFVEGGIINIVNTADANWKTVYGSVENQYVWNGLRTTNKPVDLWMNSRMKYGSTPWPDLEEGWLITKELDLNSFSPSKGVSIKSYTATGITSYDYIYSEPGTYNVTFVMTNGNHMDGMVSKNQEITLIVE